ncbi:hypothetical protein FCF25_10075 [Haloprofundus sp. MHR1]|nr:hypothetical protein FCF25_10075 [Haloprofundus sp. MHR1]
MLALRAKEVVSFGRRGDTERTANREPRTANREPRTANREPRTDGSLSHTLRIACNYAFVA